MTGLTRRTIESAMRKVDGGTPSITIRDARLPGLSLAVGKASARWRLDYNCPSRAGGGRLASGLCSATSPPWTWMRRVMQRPQPKRRLQRG